MILASMIAEPSMQPFQAFGLNFIFSQGIVIARPVKVDDVAGVRSLEEPVSGPASLNWLSMSQYIRRNHQKSFHPFNSSSINLGQFVIAIFSGGSLLNISMPCSSTNLSSEKSRNTFLWFSRHSKIFSSKSETHSPTRVPSSFSLTVKRFSYTLSIRSTDALPFCFGSGY
jgi:hypothetical protein